MVMPILQKKKLRPREVNLFVEGHPASKGQVQESDPSSQPPECSLFATNRDTNNKCDDAQIMRATGGQQL